MDTILIRNQDCDCEDCMIANPIIDSPKHDRLDTVQPNPVCGHFANVEAGMNQCSETGCFLDRIHPFVELRSFVVAFLSQFGLKFSNYKQVHNVVVDPMDRILRLDEIFRNKTGSMRGRPLLVVQRYGKNESHMTPPLYLEAVEAGRLSLGNLSKQRLLREKNWLSFVQNEK